MLELKLLLLLFTANSTPVIARDLLGERWQAPVDGGWILQDGQPLFGASKTWRGICSAVVATTIVAVLFGLPMAFGLLFGLCSMLGDLLSSFIKRRQGKPCSSRALGLDQIPEALLPLLLGHWWVGISWLAVMVLSLVFMLAGVLISPILYKIGIRNRPY